MKRAELSPLPPRRNEQIERIAAELFFKKGYHGTRLRDIAHAVGVQPATIYHHFESKQALLFAVLSSTLDDLTDTAQQVLVAEADPRGQLRGLVREFVKLVAARPREGSVGETELVNLEPGNRAALVEKRDRYQRLFEHVLNHGRDVGVFDVADVKVTVYAILGMCNYVSLWYRPRGRLTVAEVTELLANTALRMAGAAEAQIMTGAATP
jgi:AcrR family transcriptional regulator